MARTKNDPFEARQPRVQQQPNPTIATMQLSTIRGQHFAILLTFLFSWVLATPALAATITVCTSGCDQTTVGAAIAAANPGDTIMIGSGTYNENVVISKDLNLQGAGPALTVLNGPNNGIDNTVLVLAGVTAEVHNVTVEGGGRGNNSAGIFVQGVLTLTDAMVENNQFGVINSGGTVKILRSTLANNGDSLFIGSGISNISGTTVVSSSTISNNPTGGVSLQSGIVLLKNSTISSNGSSLVGFTSIGFVPFANGASVQVFDSTIVDSEPQSTGSIVVPPSAINIAIEFSNSILDSPYGVPNCFGVTSAISFGYNLSTDSTCALNGPGEIVNVLNVNLGRLQVNAPGTTATHAVLPGSPAIDAGNCTITAVVDDQRGVPRPQGPACDIGAYELQTPIAGNDTYKTTEEQTLTVPAPGVLGNDFSPDNLAISFATVTGTANGTLTLFPSGGLQYTPNPGFVGQDGFTYNVSDGAHNSNMAAVTFNVQRVNQPPIARSDSYTMFADQTLTIDAAHGLLANDTDPEGDPMTIANFTSPAHGKLTVNPDGSFVYTPVAGFSGTDSFLYQSTDGQNKSLLATVTLTINPNVGTITIALSTQPQATSTFHFSGSLGKFALGGGNLGSKTVQVGSGVYTINELRHDGWLLDNIACNPVAGVVVDLGNNRVQLTLSPGASVTCTFVNQRPAKVTASVYNDENHDHKRENYEPWLSGWTVQIYTAPNVMVSSQVTNTFGKAVLPNLVPGAYAVCEVLQPDWYTITPATIDPTYGMPCYYITIPPGKNMSVFFGNSTTP